MRHAKKIKKLGRTSAHRKATLAAMSSSLLEHKRITTTLPKAKALRSFVEPIINRAKDDTTHNRRQAFRRLRNKEAVKTLFGEVAEVLGDRPGGYTRVVKLGQRGGDAAEMAIIELVDFNDIKPEEGASGKKKTRRSRRKSSGASAASPAADTAEQVEERADVMDDEETSVADDVSDEIDDASETGAAESAVSGDEVVEKNEDDAEATNIESAEMEELAATPVDESGVAVQKDVEDVAEVTTDAGEPAEEETAGKSAPEAEETPADEAEASSEDDEEKAG